MKSDLKIIATANDLCVTFPLWIQHDPAVRYREICMEYDGWILRNSLYNWKPPLPFFCILFYIVYCLIAYHRIPFLSMQYLTELFEAQPISTHLHVYHPSQKKHLDLWNFPALDGSFDAWGFSRTWDTHLFRRFN